MSDSELDHFKATINLSEFAASRGYVLDVRESSRNSAVMRHPNGDKIIIARNESGGAWMYFSVRDDRDNGTVIDFLQNRSGGSLGEVRKPLRAWLGSSRPPLPLATFVRDLMPVSRDRAAVVTGEAAPANGVRRWLLRPEPERRGSYLEPRPASQLRARAVEVP